MININCIFIFLIVAGSASIFAYRVFDADDVHTVLALENEDISIVCRTGMPMAYCGFIHPNGTRYSFSGQTLAAGHCAFKIRVTKRDSGGWRCHIGKRTIGLELMQKIEVRVVSSLASVKRNVTTTHGKDVTISCVTTKDMVPLRYCRFEPPKGSPFSIDSAVTSSRAILDKYYYPTNKSLDRGDCAVTIRKARYSDVGLWTCGAGLEGDGNEYTDVVRLEVEGLYTMSTASTTGITFGTIGVILFLVILGLIAWKQRRVLGTRPRAPEIIEVQELGAMTRPESRGEARSLRFPELSSVPVLVVQPPSTPGSSPRGSLFSS